MSSLGICLGNIAPYYNLVLVVILIILFIKLFKGKNKGIYVFPWKLLFGAILIYVLEEVLTVFAGLGMIAIPKIVAPIFEMMIITLFIYMLLLQREYVETI